MPSTPMGEYVGRDLDTRAQRYSPYFYQVIFWMLLQKLIARHDSGFVGAGVESICDERGYRAEIGMVRLRN